MELKGLSEFRRDLEIIQRFQKKMISILSCVESQLSTSSQIKKLFDFFEQISIFQHFPLYEAFLRILVHLSIYFNFHETKDEEIISKRQEIFILILKELVLKPSLKTSIHLSTLTLYLIFKSNKQLILFFFKEGIFDTLFLIRTISLFHDSNLFLFFIPEIQKSHPKFYGKLKKQFSFIQEDVNTLYDRLKEKSQEEDSQIKEFEIRRKIHSQEEIAKIIRSDDINNFIEYFKKRKIQFEF
ncbi:hypothetical protein TRFO_32563 [Tritrichomonas foetus]|uniref:Uncharacterized protein n=1 Tax=Tritrichomonas foetus TaxID=1144522 RepID=A0A1J4JNS0_9EUKA|nr:hypothetical protein TRFO_32563 [Tritrichomonas foetus]|eukprot:OHT00699.1 hypothetical protein TRFO_32563 [Tritrichomonas foetus]